MTTQQLMENIRLGIADAEVPEWEMPYFLSLPFSVPPLPHL